MPMFSSILNSFWVCLFEMNVPAVARR